MSLPIPSHLKRELAIAAQLARDAGNLALAYRDDDLRVEMKAGNEPVSVADRAASELIVEGLTNVFPNDVIISEENADDLRRLDAERVWFIDPIDGTKDYIDGREGFCVMIGLAQRHEPVVGAIFQPVGERLFVGARGGGAWFYAPGEEPRRLRCSNINDLTAARLVASKSHRSRKIDQVKSALGISTEFNIGSVGLKVALICLAERDLYVNPSPRCRAWDICAPEVLLVESGGRITDLAGAPLRYDEKDLYCRSGIVASNGLLHESVIARLAALFPSAAAIR